MAFEENQQIEMLGRSGGGDAFGEFPFFGGEIAAGDEVGFGDGAA